MKDAERQVSDTTKFRVLASEPLSFEFEDQGPLAITIRGIPCRFFTRPAFTSGIEQRSRGGALIAVEFSLTAEHDILAAGRIGLDLVNDLISALAIVEGATLRDASIVQIIELGAERNGFVQFLPLSQNHWDKPIARGAFRDIQRLVAHWDGLDTGERLRRAARQFRAALADTDDIGAFQRAYMGLEALEKPLGDSMSIEAGVEEVEGKCQACGVTYKRKRSALAAVRAYVTGGMHPEMASEERQREWKEMNRLRQELFHSLANVDGLKQRAREILPAAMHYLHDAICCLSHSHNLESAGFRFARAPRQLVAVGVFDSTGLDRLEPCAPILKDVEASWSKHHQYGFVPEVHFHNDGIPGLGMDFCWLNQPLANAQVNDLEPVNFETGEGDASGESDRPSS